MIEIFDELDKTHRELTTRPTPKGEAGTVLLRRTYDADVADVWDACTTAERIGRWLTPVSGDLRLGGTYQLEGNAGGEILRCEPPKLLRVSWVFDGSASEVEVRLADAGDGKTEFELEHQAVDVDPDFWAKFGPGAVGVGWDLALLGLAAHLAGEEFEGGPEQILATPEAQEFMTRSGRAWGAVHAASGASGADDAMNAAERTIAAFTGSEAGA